MNVLIVDDHTSVRRGLKHIVESEWQGSIVKAVADADAALAALPEQAWDIVIADISLQGRDGLALVRELRERSPGLSVLVHSMHPEDQFAVRAIRAGAAGYITKDAPVEDLFAAIRKIVSGGRYVTPSLADLMANALAQRGTENTLESLSDRELEILRLITSGKSPTDIATQLQLSIKTVSTYRGRLLEKLNLRTTADLIRFGLENGLGV